MPPHQARSFVPDPSWEVHNGPMRGRFLALFCCFTAFLSAQAPAPETEFLRDAQEHLLARDYEGAAVRFEQAYNWLPSFEAAFQAGYSHFEGKRFSEAELWLERASRLDADSEQALVYLASAQIANYKLNSGVALLQEFVTRHPEARQASAMLAAIRSDLGSGRGVARSISVAQLFLGATLLLSLLLFFAAMRAGNAGVREAGKGMGGIALGSIGLLSAFPPLLGLAGFAWAGYKFYSGFQLYRFLKQQGSWAALMRSELYKFTAEFIRAAGPAHPARVGMALDGLMRAGMDPRAVREVEAQLHLTQFDPAEVHESFLRFASADRLIREALLRLLAGMALELGYGEGEKLLLLGSASILKLENRLPDLLTELGGAAAEPTISPPQITPAHEPLAACFRILDVAHSASRREVKSGYRRQVKRCHPDAISYLGPEFAAEAAERFRIVQNAYKDVCKARGWEQ